MDPRPLLPNEWLMIIFFLLGLVVWAIYLRKHGGASLASSFLADRKVPGFLASLSTVATNMNANDFIGMAGAAYGVGLIMLHSPLLNAVAILFLAFVLMHKLRRHNVFTLGHWLRERYDERVGHTYSLIWTFVWMLFNMGLYLYAGALVLHTLVGWNLYAAIAAISCVAAAYTLVGGFRAVVTTDALQLFLMFFPFMILTVLVWQEVGGPIALLRALPAPRADLWAAETPFGPLSLTIGGMLLMSLSYWSSEAQIIQRPLSARDPEQAMVSYIGAGFWYALLVPLFVFLPGLAAAKLYPGLTNNDFAVPMLLRQFIPPGLYGITIVGLLAGVFSSCDSQINAFCTMFTTDIYQHLLRRNPGTARLLRISQIAGVIFTLSAIATAVTFSFASHGMFLFAIAVLATIMPPFGAITILGALAPRISARGAFAGLLSGMGVAVGMLVLEFTGLLRSFAGDTLFLRAGAAFLTTLAVAIGAGRNEPHPAAAPTSGTAEPAADRKRLLVPAALLAGLVLAMYLFISWI